MSRYTTRKRPKQQETKKRVKPDLKNLRAVKVDNKTWVQVPPEVTDQMAIDKYNRRPSYASVGLERGLFMR